MSFNTNDCEYFEPGNIVVMLRGQYSGQKVKVIFADRYDDGSTYMEGNVIGASEFCCFTESMCTKVKSPGVDCVF